MCRPRRLDPHRRFTTVLDPLSLDLVWPQEDRRALPRHLFDRLKVDPELRQLCGDPGRGDISAVPSSGEDAPDGEFIGHASILRINPARRVGLIVLDEVAAIGRGVCYVESTPRPALWLCRDRMNREGMPSKAAERAAGSD